MSINNYILNVLKELLSAIKNMIIIFHVYS